MVRTRNTTDIPSNTTTPNRDGTITPPPDSLVDLLVYAAPRLSDWLRRLTDIKSGTTAKLRMSPSTGLWLSLALVGIAISANSYAVGIQGLPLADGDFLTTVIPLGRADATFRPMVLFPPVLLWLSHVVNFCVAAVGLLIPDLPLMGSSPEWHPTVRPTVWSNASLALAWWAGLTISILVSSTQGLFTRAVGLDNQRAYAQRLNKINKIDLNPKAISPAKRAVRKANHYGQGAIFLMCLLACAGWGWELFVADGALTGTAFGTQARWIYGLASTFMAELCWAIAQFSNQKI